MVITLAPSSKIVDTIAEYRYTYMYTYSIRYYMGFKPKIEERNQVAHKSKKCCLQLQKLDQ